jgi:hypothetical protein
LHQKLFFIPAENQKKFIVLPLKKNAIELLKRNDIFIHKNLFLFQLAKGGIEREIYTKRSEEHTSELQSPK